MPRTHVFARTLACMLLATNAGRAGAQAPAGVPATAPATVREYQAEMVTYPFSDPNPIPVVGKIYPYFRFDGFTATPTKRVWKVIDLENRYIRVSILPEIGGKIWRAIDKTTGKSFIYDNHVVKFRDIAMRGPWTSGGIEANYGIIGHTPNVATPVDYVVERNADGSVTATIGALDLLTRTSWRLAISLPRDKAYFTTSSFWHNGTPFEQPYYSWMNAAIPVGDDLEYVYPGNRFIGHGGELGDWPVNTANGKAIARYPNNDFGGSKSYHVFGNYTDFFGAYWHKADFGMARYAPHDEKPGKKLWIWGLARQGMIWEQLLTDADGQYTEVQSGRLFNQTAEASSLTPFKHRGFAPYSSDRWTEFWLPVKGTGGFVVANNWGALNVQHGAARITLALSPVQRIDDTLEVFDGARRVFAKRIVRMPLEAWHDSLPAIADFAKLRVALGGHKLEWSADSSVTALERPVAAPATYNRTSAEGRYLAGKEKLRERDYLGARVDLTAAVAADSNLVAALVDLAELSVRFGDVKQGLALARRALSIDTYDPAANFIWGIANMRAGRTVDARDGFDIASQSVEYRSAAFTALAKLYLRASDYDRAVTYAGKALDYDRFDLDALHAQAVAHRLRHDNRAADSSLAAMESLDRLSHAAHFERALRDGSDAAFARARALVRNEMPGETLFELALWYVDVGQFASADRLLALAPATPELLYWRAFLHDKMGRSDATSFIELADATSPRFTFPSRVESVEVMAWAATRTSSWVPRYLLGLLRLTTGDSATARTLLDATGRSSSFAPLYALRAELFKGLNAAQSLADVRRAVELEPAEWRYQRQLAERVLADGDVDAAVRLSTALYERAPRNATVEMLHARVLLRSGNAERARELLDTITVLPYEGAGEAHALYREANLLGAVARMRAGDASGARALIAKARDWPERLGAGKPYAADVDERLENLLELWAGRARDASATLDAQTQAMLSASPDVVTQRVLRALLLPGKN